MFTNTPDEHFVLDLHPLHRQVPTARWIHPQVTNQSHQLR
jgi:hypothetical protein